MIYPFNRQPSIKQYTRLVLALFVLSIINMAMQVPVHAAMQQSMQMSSEMSLMAEAEMQHCKCAPVMCETVDALSNRGAESSSSININYLLGFQVIYFSSIYDSHQQPSALRLNHHEWQYRQVSPPPLSISSILHI